MVADDGLGDIDGETALARYKMYWNIISYIIFWSLFTAIFYSARPSDKAFEQSQSVRDALGVETALKQVTDRGAVFSYLSDFLVPALWQFQYYNGVSVRADDVNTLAYYNKVVGAVRVRMQKM